MSEPVRHLRPRDAPDPPEPANADTPALPLAGRDPRSVALTVIAVAAAIAMLKWGQEVFIPIVVSILISYALEPVVTLLMRLRLPRIVSAAVVVAAFVGAFGWGVYTLSDDVAAVVTRLPEAAQKVRGLMRHDPNDPGAIDHVQRAAQEIQKTADEATGTNPAPRGVTRVQVESPTIDVRQYLYWGSTGVIAFGGQAVLVTFFVFFLLAAGDLYKRKLVKLAGPSLQKKKITVQILDDINMQIEKFLVVRVVTSIVVGVGTWLAFRLIGVEQPEFWGLAAGVINSIPYFGPVLVAAATAVVGLLQFGTLYMALYVSGVSLLITSLEGWLLTPWLTSRTARTNELAVFVGLIFWSWVWGIWGALLAVPMLVVVKAYCDRIEDLKPIGELLGP